MPGVGEHLAVVTGLPRADRWREVRAAQVDQLLERARDLGQVVVDTGFSLEDEAGSDFGGRPGRNTLTLAALDVADEVVVVGAADPVGLARLARGLVDLRDRAGGVPVRVVVNRMRGSIGWSEREIAGMVEGFSRVAGLHFLPEDRAGARPRPRLRPPAGGGRRLRPRPRAGRRSPMRSSRRPSGPTGRVGEYVAEGKNLREFGTFLKIRRTLGPDS